MSSSRRHFEHNMHLLSERMERGQIHVSESSAKSMKGLRNAKFGPNRRPNLQTIDEMARLMANMMSNMANRFGESQEDDQ